MMGQMSTKLSMYLFAKEVSVTEFSDLEHRTEYGKKEEVHIVL